MSKLPDLYTNSFDKKIDKSLDYITIKNDDTNITNSTNTNNIKEKINNLFKSKSYIYKINVLINLKNEDINCTLIGKTKNNLITIDNKLISIKDIVDIKKID